MIDEYEQRRLWEIERELLAEAAKAGERPSRLAAMIIARLEKRVAQMRSTR